MPPGEIPQIRVTIATMSPIQRLMMTLLALVGLAIGIVIVIPLALLMGALGLAMLAWMRVRRLFGGDPSARDGRRNVRVIQRSN